MLNGSESTNTRHASALQRGATALALLLTLACARPTSAADDAPVGARAGLEIATAAAQSFRPRAQARTALMLVALTVHLAAFSAQLSALETGMLGSVTSRPLATH